MTRFSVSLLAFFCLSLQVFAEEPPHAETQDITFVDHVRPLMQRLGCAAFRCHGGIHGKGEFRLSRNGLNIDADYAEVLKQCQPDPPSGISSFLNTIQEHEGGERIALGRYEKQLLQRWIEQGNPKGKNLPLQNLSIEPAFVKCENGKARIRIIALQKDGSRQSVTNLVVTHLKNPSIATVGSSGEIQGHLPGSTGFSVSYRGVSAYGVIVVPVEKRPSAISTLQERNFIDHYVGRSLESLNVSPSPEASSKILLRRICFDLTGHPPTLQEYAACPDEWSQTQYAQYVAQLIDSDRFARKWGRWLAELSGCNETNLSPAAFAMKVRNEPLAFAWYEWTRKRIALDIPYCEIVRSQIAATSRGNRSTLQYSKFHEKLCETLKGNFDSSTFIDEANNDLFWKTTLSRRSEFVARQFLGIDLKCARCHDHPSERWTQDDYNAFAAVFNRVVYQEQPLTRHNKRQVLSYLAGGTALGFFILLGVSLKLRKSLPIISRLLFGIAVIAFGLATYCSINYLHLLHEKMTFTARGFGVYFVDQLCPWADSQLKVILIGGLAIAFCLIVAVLVFRSQKIVAKVAGWGAVALIAFLIAGTIDTAYVHSLGENQDRFSGVHALHHALLRTVGMGGRRQQPREIFISHSADRSDEFIPAVPAGPHFRNGIEDDPRVELIDWAIQRDPNQLLARNIVNRVWAEIMGEGLVSPLDNFTPANPPGDPFLLDGLVSDFIKHNWSLKHLIRQIVYSSAYRRSSISFDDPRGARPIRPLQAAEQFHLIEAMAGAGFRFGKNCNPLASTAYDAFVRIKPTTPADKFMKQLLSGSPKSKKDIPLSAAINSLHDNRRLTLITDSKQWTGELTKVGTQTKIDQLSLLAMGRILESQNRKLLVEYVDQHEDQQTAWNDILWALLNSEEAQFNY